MRIVLKKYSIGQKGLLEQYEVKNENTAEVVNDLAKKYFNLNIINASLKEVIANNQLLPGTFDIIFAFELIEHINKPKETLSLLNKLLASGGIIVISTPNFYLFDLMKKPTPIVKAFISFEEHINFFTPMSLEKCIKQCRFDIINITTICSLSYGDRKKQILLTNNKVSKIWNNIKHIKIILCIKNMIFKILDKRKETSDVQNLTGTSIVCIAKKR